MVLDTLVVKELGSGDGLLDVLADNGDNEGADTMKLGVKELWNMLSEGAGKVFSLAEDGTQDYGTSDYNILMSDAQPENWDDKTGVNGDNSDIKPFSGEQAELDKTKCFKLK